METKTSSFHILHETHRETLLKFLALVTILIAYFVYMSWKFDASTSFGLALLSWSFFVLCTPVADGGFILAFPIRLLFGIKMAISQVVLWFIAVGINIVMLIVSSKTYELTFLTRLLKRILTEPIPYWSILIVSALGTFLSIYFGDEMMDVSAHKHRDKYHHHGFKYRTILVIAFGIVTVMAYYDLLNSLNIKLPG